MTPIPVGTGMRYAARPVGVDWLGLGHHVDPDGNGLLNLPDKLVMSQIMNGLPVP